MNETLIEQIKDKLDEDLYKHQSWILNYAVDTAIKDWTKEELESFLAQISK